MRLARRRFEVPCTLDIEQTHDCFHAHVVLDGDIDLRPGDRVQVHGAPVKIAFGDRLMERRRATVTKATALTRAWTKIAARFQLADLYDVSFSSQRLP